MASSDEAGEEINLNDTPSDTRYTPGLYLTELQIMSIQYPDVVIEDSPNYETWVYEHIVRQSSHNIKDLHSLWFSIAFEHLTYQQLKLGQITQESNVKTIGGDEYRVNLVEPGGKIVSLLRSWCKEPLAWKSYQLKQFSRSNRESLIFFINHFSEGWKDIVLLMRGHHSLSIEREYLDPSLGKTMYDLKITTTLYVDLKNPLSESIFTVFGQMTVHVAKKLLKKSIGDELGQVFSFLPDIVEYEDDDEG